MKNNIHPCLWFNGNAKAAADFYCSLFPGSNITANNQMVVNFELSGQKFMGLNGGPQFIFNPSISFFIISESDEEIDELYKQLSNGGMVMMALGKYDWSEYYAFVQDRFGLAWQIMKGNMSNMNQKITPSLLFVGSSFGKASQAVRFYTELFPQSSINRILLYTNEEGDAAGKVKHSQFILDGKVFTAMDGAGPHNFAFNEAVSFVVECNYQQEIDFFWNKLIADGGQESNCGWLKDKFGVSWQVVPTILGKLMSDPAKAPQVMQAFLQMKKFDIAALEKAAE